MAGYLTIRYDSRNKPEPEEIRDDSGRPGCWGTNESMTRSRTRQPVKPDPSSSTAAPVPVPQLPAAPEPSSCVKSVCQAGLPDGTLQQQLQALLDSEAAASCVHASARMAHTVRAVRCAAARAEHRAWKAARRCTVPTATASSRPGACW